MYADEFILSLNNLQIENKNLLPNYSGIYYVVDEELIIWYIGQSKNLQKRWNGDKPHHRFHQLQSIAISKQKQLFLYFYQTTNNQRYQEEKKYIKKYQPLLNYTPVIKATNSSSDKISCLSSESQTLKILSNKSNLIKVDNFHNQKMIVEIEDIKSKRLESSNEKEKEFSDTIIKLQSNQFKRQFIYLKDDGINLNLQIEVCIDLKNRLFVRHHTISNIYGWGIKIIKEQNDSNAENALLNLNSKCTQLYNYSFKWLGYKLNCKEILLIDEEDDFEIETLAIMLPFRMFIDLVEYLWRKNSSLSETLDTQETPLFRSQSLDIKIAKYLHDRNLTLMTLTEKIN